MARIMNTGPRMDDASEYLEPILADNDTNFKKFKTIRIFSIHLLISTIISIVGIVFAFAWPAEQRCKAYFIMLYLRAAFWIVTFVFDHVIKHKHNELRLAGYHNFHAAIAVHKSVPLYIVSLWNTVLLGVAALIHDEYGPNFGEHCLEVIFSPIVYVNLFQVTETVLLYLVHGSYISKVHKFNAAAPMPDALTDSNQTDNWVGLMQRGANTVELLEKQADLITYLKDHNQNLKRKLMQLHARVQTITMATDANAGGQP